MLSQLSWLASGDASANAYPHVVLVVQAVSWFTLLSNPFGWCHTGQW
jgi:hypothetical protein